MILNIARPQVFLLLSALIFLLSSCALNKQGASDSLNVSPQPTGTAFANTDEINLSEIRFVCTNESLRPIWIDLLKEPKLTGVLFQSQLQPVYDCTNLLKTTEIDLNSDGKTETVVRMDSVLVCSPTSNCPLAIYGFFEDGVFNTSAGAYDFRNRRLFFTLGAISFEQEQDTSNGYQDLMVRFNGSSYPDSLELFKFDGKRYERKQCFQEDKPTGKRSREECIAKDTP